MTGEGPTTFWPLFDLVVRTPRLELRLVREEDFADLVELIDGGIHDPGTMPFFFPWTDAEPQRRAREAAQWMWRHRANWAPDNWTFTGAAFVDGKPVGVQSVEADTSVPFDPSRRGPGSVWRTRVRVWDGRCARPCCTWPSPGSGRPRR